MKIRNGFVSNSSTSSFIIISTKDNYDKTMAELHPYAQAVITGMVEEFSLAGIKFISVACYTGMSGEGTLDWIEVDFDGEIPKDKHGSEMSRYDAYDSFCFALKKNGETFSADIGDGG